MSRGQPCRSLGKSPRRIVRIALAVATTALPKFFNRYSRHDFEQRQHFAMLVLRMFLKTDYRGVCEFIADLPDLQKDLGLKRVPHYSTLCRAAVRLAKQFERLLDQVLVQALSMGLLGGRIRAAVDTTGLEERHASKHYIGRCHRKKRRERYWTKWGIVSDEDSHLILGTTVTRGPGDEYGLWKPLVRHASRYVALDTVLGDAGFDSEFNHEYARRNRGVRLTVIALNPRTHGRKWPQTKYRRQMRRRFLRRVYKQRAHVESTFSQHKRVLGSSLRARTRSTRRAETLLRVLVHNILILRSFPLRVATEHP